MCCDILFILLYIRVTWSWHVYDCSVYVLSVFRQISNSCSWISSLERVRVKGSDLFLGHGFLKILGGLVPSDEEVLWLNFVWWIWIKTQIMGESKLGAILVFLRRTDRSRTVRFWPRTVHRGGSVNRGRSAFRSADGPQVSDFSDGYWINLYHYGLVLLL